ncbi:unannotated protein [freshwater metagenome]|uniref:Unannotated protein n=1 Tax=freshwater metagenome TaxID=449393 RepID=A0A6J6RZA7_9ZZZZ|nr:hypothetical protein [Actinomycetota bacterium]
MSDDPHLDRLPRGATGDWEIVTENGTRILLTGLGTDDPRWWRVPGTPESSRAYSDRPYRLAALRALPDEDTWSGEPPTVGMRATIGQGQFSDLWHTSRVVAIRRIDATEPLLLPGFLVAERLGLDGDAIRERAAERQAGEADE